MDELRLEVERLKSGNGGNGSGGKGEQKAGKGKRDKGSKGGGGAQGGDGKGHWLDLARKHRKIKHIAGVKLCWSFNSGQQCRANCSFDHLCAYCGSPDHPLWMCRDFKELKLQ